MSRVSHHAALRDGDVVAISFLDILLSDHVPNMGPVNEDRADNQYSEEDILYLYNETITEGGVAVSAGSICTWVYPRHRRNSDTFLSMNGDTTNVTDDFKYIEVGGKFRAHC